MLSNRHSAPYCLLLCSLKISLLGSGDHEVLTTVFTQSKTYRGKCANNRKYLVSGFFFSFSTSTRHTLRLTVSPRKENLHSTAILKPIEARLAGGKNQEKSLTSMAVGFDSSWHILLFHRECSLWGREEM